MQVEVQEGGGEGLRKDNRWDYNGRRRGMVLAVVVLVAVILVSGGLGGAT